jgi:CheY-like chemotaxis protein/anti-sigma regulatory factor (Ser/Thr protein kinase)
LVNVISNAIKFTDEGSILVIAGAEKSGGIIKTKFTIEDTGIGIDKDQVNKIFDEFRQLEYYLTKRIKGTGLGLAITKKLVNLLHGTITVESEPGKGSRFTIEIPFRHKKEEKNIKMTDDPTNQPIEDLRKIKILLAEDNEANQFLIKAITKSKGWEITVVDDGKQAVDAFSKDHFDMILMDVQMPVMNGYEATKLIREKETGKENRIPIIALTAYAMQSDKELCLKAGMDNYISKPFRRQQFLDVISEVLKENR